MTEGIPPNLEEYQQLNRSLLEKMLDNAAIDPQWKQRLLEDPEAATGDFPEAHWLKELYESGAAAPTEKEEAVASPEAMPSAPPPREGYQQLQRSLWEKVLDKAASDPAWKQLLLEEPEAALREADFPETQRLSMLQEEAEVRGHSGGLEIAGRASEAPGSCGYYPRRVGTYGPKKSPLYEYPGTYLTV